MHSHFLSLAVVGNSFKVNAREQGYSKQVPRAHNFLPFPFPSNVATTFLFLFTTYGLG